MQATNTVVMVFDERDDARDAINELKDAGFRGEDIGLVARDRGESREMAAETGTHAGEGAATGAITGGIIGGLGGFLAGIGALAIPVVGPVIAAGALGSALTGAAVGAGVGAIAGALIGMGVPKEEAEWYEERVKSGGWLVSVNSAGRYEEARAIMRDHGGHDYQSSMSSTGYRNWDEVSPTFRSDYERQYGTSGTWSTHEPAHRYGYEAYGRSSQTGTSRTWDETEPELRSDWESRGQGSWDEARGHVRHGYDYGRGRRRFRDDDDTKGTAGGALAGGAAGAMIGGAVAGPPGAVGGALLGGAGGAKAGDKAEDAVEGDGDFRR
jgi:hypothetical protein